MESIKVCRDITALIRIYLASDTLGVVEAPKELWGRLLAFQDFGGCSEDHSFIDLIYWEYGVEVRLS